MASGLLVSYAGYPYTPSSFMLDNGLANLAAALLAEGHQVKILDFGTISTMRRLYPPKMTGQVRPVVLGMLQADAGADTSALLRQMGALAEELDAFQACEVNHIAEETAAEVRRLQPDFVGFKLWNGDGFSGSIAIARHLRREFPHLKLYAGGPHASWFREYIYRAEPIFDAVCYGEGEQKIADLARHSTGKCALADIPGIIYADGSRIITNPPDEGLVMDQLPEPVYDAEIYPAMDGDEKIKVVVLDDSRGCPYQCNFCTHPVESGCRLRTKSALRLVDDIERIIKRHGIYAFRFAGSSTPGRLMAETAAEIIARDLHITYTSFGHFRSSVPEHFPLMRRSGLSAIFFGIETGSPDLLERAVGKGTRMEDIKSTVMDAKQAGIYVVCSMIVPLPFETPETLKESMDFLLEVRPDSVPVQFPGILPGTPWFNEAEKFNIELDRDSYLLENLAYKIKLLLPVPFWKPLPYRINGLSFHEFAAITKRFADDLEARGILVNLPDDNAMIAQLAGIDYREFRDLSRLWCVTGEVETMAQMVTDANRRATRPADPVCP